ncbi:MAG: TonB-dependent receptor [Burkholderiaceae bacterium]
MFDRIYRQAAATLLIATCVPAVAEPSDAPPVPLTPVLVIGTTPLIGVGVAKDQVPSNVQTATGADIDRSHAEDLGEFMRRRLGSVYVNDVQNNPFQPDINYRGFTASPLLGTPQGLSVFVDGVRVNQPFGDVVSWDLIPRAAIANLTLMPGSNPVFGLNTLGGALSVTTKDGWTAPGSSIELRGGSYGRFSAEFETGGSAANGLSWYLTGSRFHDQGWRDASPTDVAQLFGKLGWRSADSQLALSIATADNDLTGNGLQEQGMLSRNPASVYTLPDNTRNKSWMLNLVGSHRFNDMLSVSGNTYYRNIRTGTTNGDVNDNSLDQAVYQPSAAEQTALRNAGYSGFPTAGANAVNTPFPKWRCIANVLLNDEPAEKCDGVINTTHTLQNNEGLSAQLDAQGDLAGHRNLFVAGVAYDLSHVRFTQGSELGYLNPDRGLTGVGGFGDGGVTGGNVNGDPYDTRVDLTGRTQTASLFATDTFAIDPRTHLTVSGRFNNTRVRTRDAIVPGGGPGSLDGDNRFSRFNPAAGLTFAPVPRVTLYAGYNQGTRAPSVIELGCADPANPCKLPNSFAGDPPLRQVVARTFEAGVRGGDRRGVDWNLGVFRTDNKDDILFVADNAAGFGYFKNFGRTRRQGIEAGITARADPVTVGANYTLLDATYRSAETVNGASNSSNDHALVELPGVDGNITIAPGDRIPLTPRHLFKAFVDVAIASDWSVGLDMIAIGHSFARGNGNNQHAPDGTLYVGPGGSAGYAVFNLGVDYRPTKRLKWFAQVNNLFDRGYNTASQLGAAAFGAGGGFQARPFAANANGDFPLRHSTFYSPGAPRTVVLGMRYSFAD